VAFRQHLGPYGWPSPWIDVPDEIDGFLLGASQAAVVGGSAEEPVPKAIFPFTTVL
jgi:hypothetical protein